MPHVTIKHFAPALPDERKQELAAALTALVVGHFGTYEGAVSIGLQPVDPASWQREVFDPEIEGLADTLIKTPDYDAVGGSR
jgi:4-oxalocrotonate tautomerase